MKYTLNEDGRVISIGAGNDKIEITDEPFKIEDCQDWRFDKVLDKWIFDPIIMVTSISKLQAVSRLIDIGKYEELMTALDSDATGVKRILFDAAHQLDRDSNMVVEMAVALGFDEAGTDDFFIEASKIMV